MLLVRSAARSEERAKFLEKAVEAALLVRINVNNEGVTIPIFRMIELVPVALWLLQTVLAYLRGDREVGHKACHGRPLHEAPLDREVAL